MPELAIARRERDAKEMEDRISQSEAAITCGSKPGDATLVVLAAAPAPPPPRITTAASPVPVPQLKV